ncbi:hypothetical protein [Vibrio parahaemolyticus]|uniref:hypothetical protein n=1 Tax=Vibrio parahaemolyticus TaxID=670 RepID=UPI00215C6F7C|nr:hypothetical protein [Vibrio parahaemolyticus]MCR9834225.1 hypothetical protein [Vibrio parahaemolyticus]
MKILYVDIRSILYSNRYLNSIEGLLEQYKLHVIKGADHLLEYVEPDREGAKKIARAANEAGLLIYPTGTRYTRELLIKHNVFCDEQLAPVVQILMRPRDTDALRLLIAHANFLNAEWYVCGDLCSDERAQYIPERYLVSSFEEGVSDELISKITAID